MSRIGLAVGLSLMLVLQGCTSMQALEVTDNRRKIAAQINIGDEVNITTRNGEKYTMEVVAVTDGKLVGEKVTVGVDDIEAIDVRKFSQVKTGLLVLYLVLGAFNLASQTAVF